MKPRCRQTKGRFLAVSSGGRSVATYDTGATKVDQQKLAGGVTNLTGSADYSTLVTNQGEQNEELINLVAHRDGTSTDLKPPSGAHHVYISPDGLHIVVTVESASGETAYLADVPLR